MIPLIEVASVCADAIGIQARADVEPGARLHGGGEPLVRRFTVCRHLGIGLPQPREAAELALDTVVIATAILEHPGKAVAGDAIQLRLSRDQVYGEGKAA